MGPHGSSRFHDFREYEQLAERVLPEHRRQSEFVDEASSKDRHHAVSSEPDTEFAFRTRWWNGFRDNGSCVHEHGDEFRHGIVR